jgi:hypothetical protein
MIFSAATALRDLGSVRQAVGGPALVSIRICTRSELPLSVLHGTVAGLFCSSVLLLDFLPVGRLAAAERFIRWSRPVPHSACRGALCWFDLSHVLESSDLRLSFRSFLSCFYGRFFITHESYSIRCL